MYNALIKFCVERYLARNVLYALHFNKTDHLITCIQVFNSGTLFTMYTRMQYTSLT